MKKLLAFYGDDFTGSTDVMEALASHGIETVLFTRLPTPSEQARFSNAQAIGLAGTSRSQSPDWMDQHLPPIFTWLKSFNARYTHYKVCSTFDSSPHIGSIGRAADIGAHIFQQSMIPLIVGTPQLKRYTFAGHLFAGYQGQTYRIDRHPVMSRHPVTPMQESDLRLHLAKQTELPSTIATESWPSQGVALIDVHDAATQIEAGHKLLSWAGGFVMGSSGVEYAMVKALKNSQTKFTPLDSVTQIAVISGSVSLTTERQIKYALQHGFESVSVNPLAFTKPDEDIRGRTITAALDILNKGKSPIIHTALGPTSDESKQLDQIPEGRQRLGENLGSVLKAIIERTGLRRVIVAGGDTSSHALGQLDVFALTTRLPLPATPGSPLCTAHSNTKIFDGMELALKGGQVGGDDYFVHLRDG